MHMHVHVCVISYIYICTYVIIRVGILLICFTYFSMPDALKKSQSSLVLEVNQFLQYVKDKFSEVLLPVESISKQGLLGKGYINLCMTINAPF